MDGGGEDGKAGWVAVNRVEGVGDDEGESALVGVEGSCWTSTETPRTGFEMVPGGDKFQVADEVVVVDGVA